MKQSTADLVALNLRSESAVIARLITKVDVAVQAGHSHQSIHEALVAGGLAVSWTNYRIAVGRARKAQRNAAFNAASPCAPTLPACAAPALDIAPTMTMTYDAREANPLADTSSTTGVMNALRQAREIAVSKDYGKIGRDLYRHQQREQKKQLDPLRNLKDRP